MAWKLGFKLWWTSPPRLTTRLAVMPHDRKWAWHWPVYIFYVWCSLSGLISIYNQTRLFKSIVGTILSPPPLKANSYHLLSSPHIWKASKASPNTPHYHDCSVKAYPLNLREKSMMERGVFLFLMRTGYKHDLSVVVWPHLFAESCIIFGIWGWL